MLYASRMESDFDKTIRDVCAIFKEVTGAEADPRREGQAIVPWVRDFKWQLHDFRLIMEFSLSDAKEAAYFSTPGKMNIRSMFNPARGNVLLDIHADLKRAQAIQLRKQEMKKSGGLTRSTAILLRCGAQIPVGDVDAFERHNDECFAAKGSCFPDFRSLI